MSGELLRGLAALLELPRTELEPVADALELGPLPARSEHADLFTLQLVPYASVYLGNDGQIGGEARERIAGFWRALEVALPKEPDHLAALLLLYAGLEGSGQETDPEALASLRHRRRALLGEHLLPWLPIYLKKLRTLAPPFYAAWADLLESVLEREAQDLEPPGEACAHWQAAEALPDAGQATLEDLVAAVLSPVRGGLVLTRSDLTAAARELGVAGRIGERRFMLEAMLRQRPRQVLEWLGRYLRTVAQSYSGAPPYGRSVFVRASHQVEHLEGMVRDLVLAAG